MSAPAIPKTKNPPRVLTNPMTFAKRARVTERGGATLELVPAGPVVISLFSDLPARAIPGAAFDTNVAHRAKNTIRSTCRA